MRLKCKCGQQYLDWNTLQYKVNLRCYQCGHDQVVIIPPHIPRLQWIKYVGNKLNEMS